MELVGRLWPKCNNFSEQAKDQDMLKGNNLGMEGCVMVSKALVAKVLLVRV